MAKKNATPSPEAAAPKSKRTPLEKAERKSQKASKQATKGLADDRAEKKASQKQTLKSAAKLLQKELDVRMKEVVTRIRKETKAKLKEVVKDATRRLDVDTERMFEQALHNIVRHYDAAMPDAPTPPATPEANIATEPSPAVRGAKKPTVNKDGAARKTGKTTAPTPAATPHKAAGRPAGTTAKSTSHPGPGRPKRQPAADTAAPELSTPAGTTNDSVAVDNV